MESEYLMEVSAYCAGFSYGPNGPDAARAAVKRLQEKCRTGNTLVMVRVANPRFKD